MRKCINLEDQPGFQQIYAPQMQQAIDRGLQGHSGTGVVDWGYIPPGGTKPVKPRNPPKVDKVELPDYKNGKHYNVKNAVKLGGDDYFDYLFNMHGTPEMRALINKFPPIPIIGERKRGYFQPVEGEYGTVHTPKGSNHDIGTLFHEYGHALDHMMGIKTGLNDSQRTSLGYSTLVMPQFIEDGVDLGLVFDDSAYWEYIEANGIDTTFGGRKVFKITKGTDRQQTEEKMKPGDHWRVMEYLLGKVKTDLQDANNAKNPDPVKIKRAEEMKARIEKLYDAHMNRVKVTKNLVKQLEKDLQPGTNAELYYQIYSVHDIIDGLSGNEIFDYSVATNDHILDAGHFPGYFSMRKQGYKEGPRNYSMKGAQAATRVEVFAQFYQFYNNQNKKAYTLLAKVMPKSAKQFEKIMKDSYNIKV
jgi:hypothetical protein|tara:strand:+ start:4183 stop:5430 length:1248 start_codon:yes stop_codon:yes gene_type:complete